MQAQVPSFSILFPIGSLYPSQAGGPSNSVYWVAKALKTNGISVSIVTTDLGINENVSLDEWLDTDYGQVIYLRTKIHYLPIRLIWLTLKVLPQHQVVHLTSLFYPPSFIIALMAFLFRKKIIWGVHGECNKEALRFNYIIKFPYLFLIKTLLAKRVLFQSTSPTETVDIRRVMGKTCRIIELPNYMEVPLLQPRKPSNYLLYLGRFHPIKALDRLLESCASSTIFRHSDTRLILAGDDQNDYGAALKVLADKLGIKERVSFIGHVEGEQKIQLLADASWLLLVSHSENFGITVIEALAQGTPVIASKGTPWQMLETTQTGFWTQNDPDILAKVLDQALSLPQIVYSNCRLRARTLVEEQFDVYANIDKWINVYK